MVMLTPDGREVEPPVQTLEAGTILFRVHSNRFAAIDYHPGRAPATPASRFAFFGDPPVPVLYAADTELGAISETILRDVPIAGGRIDATLVRSKILSPVRTRRPLRLLTLHGHGFRRVGAPAHQITRTGPDRYAQTVPWAQAAHAAGLDGIAWMSRHHDTSTACVLFGAAGGPGDVESNPDDSLIRAFAFRDHLDWLSRLLIPLNVGIAHPA